MLPLFPLHTVLFPGETIPLHVFEPRYRALAGDVIAGDRILGVVAIKSGSEVGPPSETYDVATEAEIVAAAQLDDGRYALVCRGIRRVRITKRLPDDPYPRGEAEVLGEIEGPDAAAAVAAARDAFAKLAGAVRRLGADVETPPPGPPVEDSFALAAAVALDVPVKQRLLECETAAQRLRLFEALAVREAALLDSVGPSAGIPLSRPSPN